MDLHLHHQQHGLLYNHSNNCYSHHNGTAELRLCLAMTAVRSILRRLFHFHLQKETRFFKKH